MTARRVRAERRVRTTPLRMPMAMQNGISLS
jgi:hypothetical protein